VFFLYLRHEPQRIGIRYPRDLFVRHGVDVCFLGSPHRPPNVRTHLAAQPRIGIGKASLEFESVADTRFCRANRLSRVAHYRLGMGRQGGVSLR
jgi:hypothetical protein